MNYFSYVQQFYALCFHCFQKLGTYVYIAHAQKHLVRSLIVISRNINFEFIFFFKYLFTFFLDEIKATASLCVAEAKGNRSTDRNWSPAFMPIIYHNYIFFKNYSL